MWCPFHRLNAVMDQRSAPTRSYHADGGAVLQIPYPTPQHHPHPMHSMLTVVEQLVFDPSSVEEDEDDGPPPLCAEVHPPKNPVAPGPNAVNPKLDTLTLALKPLHHKTSNLNGQASMREHSESGAPP